MPRGHLAHRPAWRPHLWKQVPAVALEPRVRFLNPRGLPKIGAYVAAAVPAAPAATNARPAAAGPDGDESSDGAAAGPAAAPQAPAALHCVLAADTLFPEGSGQPLAPEEVAFLADVARALGCALDAGEAARRRTAAAAAAAPRAPGREGSGGEGAATLGAGAAGVDALQRALEAVYAAAPAPEPVPKGGGGGRAGGWAAGRWQWGAQACSHTHHRAPPKPVHTCLDTLRSRWRGPQRRRRRWPGGGR
jgi:hypothetical protein